MQETFVNVNNTALEFIHKYVQGDTQKSDIQAVCRWSNQTVWKRLAAISAV